jgi:uncharacterized membrane-anchored protein YitT (DUF2179 family)
MRKALAYLQLTAGAVIAALAVNLFMVPTHLPSGGLGGLMLILHYLWSIPIGPVYFLANLPAVLWLWKLYGKNGLAKTIWGIGAFSLALSLTEPLGAYAPTQNLMLAALFGGAIMGLGIGLTLTAGGDTGGNQSYARILHRYTGADVARTMMLTDVAILAFGALIMNLESIMYGIVMTVVIGQTVRLVQEGLNSSRCVMIISQHPDAVGAVLMNEVRRGVTRLQGMGEYTGAPRPVLMCVVSAAEVFRVKRLVLGADSEAFVFISDAREVSGLGFTIEHEERPLPYWTSAQNGD